MKTVSFQQAQSAWDHMEDPCGDNQGREEWAYEQIKEALYGDENQYKAMLKKLGVEEEEYREEHLSIPEALAERYASEYLDIIDAEDAEYNADMRLNR